MTHDLDADTHVSRSAPAGAWSVERAGVDDVPRAVAVLTAAFDDGRGATTGPPVPWSTALR